MVEKIIRKIKRDQTYSWDNPYSFKELFTILWYRAWQLMRGMSLKFFLKKSDGLIFIGKNVKICHFSKIRFGRNIIIGDYCSVNGLSINGITLGENVSIGRNSTLLCTAIISQRGEGIYIGSGTGINDNAFLGGQGGIYIGENVIIGPYVKIFSENHLFDNHEMLIKNQGVQRKEVRIADNCWIGANSTILAGVVIGSNTIVAAGSVVTKQFKGNVLIGGVPAKILKELK